MVNGVTVDLGPNMTGLMEKLAHQLGMTVEQVYPYFVRQQVLEGWLLQLLWIAPLIFLTVEIILIVGAIKRDHGYDGEFHIGFTLMGGLISLALGAVAFGGMTSILNPHYGAIKEMVDLAGSVVK